MGPADTTHPSLAGIARQIDWSADPEALRRGDISGLPQALAHAIFLASNVNEVRALAGPKGNALAVVIGLIARSLGKSHRAAARLARHILKGLDESAVARAMGALGL
jgi:hypothetical protein